MPDHALLVAVMIDSSEEARIEREFRRKLETPAAVEEYNQLPGTQGGKILDVDIARWLCPAYAANIEGRRRWTAVTTKPASDFIRKRYELMLKPEPTGPVMFLAGGGGSGKSSVAQRLLREEMAASEIVCDGTFATYASARDRVVKALESGRPVLVVYIHREFKDAIAGVAERYRKTGRSVPARILAEDHVGAQASVLRLWDEFKDDDRLAFLAISNSNELAEISMDRLAELRYDATGSSMQAVIDRLYQVAKNGLPYEHEAPPEVGEGAPPGQA